MKRFFLVGYYGYNNFGDDLLLLSIIKILKETNSEYEVLIPSDTDFSFLNDEKIKIVNLKRFDILSLKSYINYCDALIYGGGNLFQSETSKRSFYYYYYIAKFAMKAKKKIILLSQGFGPFTGKWEQKYLKKILRYPNLIGVYRDLTSYRYAKKFESKSYFGVDIGPYFVSNIKNEKNNKKFSICLKNNYNDSSKLIEFLKIFQDIEVSTLIINSNQDTMVNYNLVEDIRKNTDLKAEFPVKDFHKLINEISSSAFLISDRLHSSLVGIYFGVPTISYYSKKNRRVIESIYKDYKYYYKNMFDISYAYYEFETGKTDFSEISNIYREKMSESISLIKKIIQSV